MEGGDRQGDQWGQRLQGQREVLCFPKFTPSPLPPPCTGCSPGHPKSCRLQPRRAGWALLRVTHYNSGSSYVLLAMRKAGSVCGFM